MSGDRAIFIIDGMNLFIRSYSAYPQMSAHGHQMGGCVGFLKTLQRLCREFRPMSVYVAWEGGGSQRRRKIFPEYKSNRKVEKLNRFYGDDIPDTEENKKHQLVSLIGMLKHAPVVQVYVSDCEADDIVAHLCSGPFKNEKKTIVSSDKDMYQLLDDKTNIYSLHKKRFVESSDVFEEFRIPPHNFAIAKALCGDASDNIPGVKGLGFKTVASKFPLLASNEVLLQEVLDYAASHIGESTAYKKVIDATDDVKRNWKLVHLGGGGMLSADQISRIENIVSTSTPSINRMGLVRALLKEGINDFDVENFFYDTNCVIIPR